MLTRPAPTTTNASLSHGPTLISFRLSLTGINPQLARHRGCDFQRAAVSSPPFLQTNP